MADKILRICGEPTVPGITLPKAFEELEKQFESIASVCSMKGSHEAQSTGILLLCHELQRLLRLSFIENGILASRIEILSRNQDECVRKTEKRLRGFETEQKVTRRYLNTLRKRQYNYEKVKKSKDKEWWKVDVSSSDYESLSGLSRITGNPNLEFMLRLNQLLLDFVKDPYTNELLLPPMGSEERAELSKLASLYKLRCRFNKSTQVATSTLIKARQTSVPLSGEVDSILNTFTRKQKDALDTDKETPSSPKEDKDAAAITGGCPLPPASSTISKSIKPSPPPPPPPPPQTASVDKPEEEAIPSYMLTPVSVMGTPTITLEGDHSTAAQRLPPELLTRASPTSKLSFDNPLSLVRPSPSVRVTKLDNRPFLQVLPSGSPSPLQAIERSLDSISSPSLTSSKSHVPLSSATSSSSAYTNLLSTSPTALHMALLMQSQQLRALTAAVTAGQTSIPPPVIPSTTSATVTTSSSTGISTVLATPLPKSLSTTSTTSPPVGRGGGIKRESGSSVGGVSSSKRYKVSRRSEQSDKTRS